MHVTGHYVAILQDRSLKYADTIGDDQKANKPIEATPEQPAVGHSTSNRKAQSAIKQFEHSMRAQQANLKMIVTCHIHAQHPVTMLLA